MQVVTLTPHTTRSVSKEERMKRKLGRLMYSATLCKPASGPWGGGGIDIIGAGYTPEEHDAFLTKCIIAESNGWHVRILDPINTEREMREVIPR